MIRWKVKIELDDGSIRTGNVPADSVTEIPAMLKSASISFNVITSIERLKCVDCKDQSTCLNNAIIEFVTGDETSTHDTSKVCNGYEHIMSQF